MNKSYQKCLLIALSTISVSLAGMEKEQPASPQQNDNNVWILKPMGGTVQLHRSFKETIYKRFDINKDTKVKKMICFATINCKDTKNPIYQYLQYGPIPHVPLNLFTEEEKYYKVTTEEFSFVIKSDRVYDEKSFVTQNEFYQQQQKRSNQLKKRII